MIQLAVTVLAETPERVKIKEEASTLVVNAHGGLLKLRMELMAGQPLTLINPQNGIRQSCRVLRIEQPSPDYFAVAFEFDHPSPLGFVRLRMYSVREARPCSILVC